jgi:AmiR/NasT family two-component response regulator
VRVIVFSGKNVPEMLQKVSALGVFACIRKPVAPEEVMRTIVKARGGSCAL